MEIRVRFSLSEKQYILFIEKRITGDRINLYECKKGSNFIIPVPIKVSTSTPGETARYWLRELKRYLVKKRNKKRG